MQQLNNDLCNLERQVRWKDFFENRADPIVRRTDENYISGFHLPSSREPPKASSATETLLLAFRTDMTENVSSSRLIKKKPNLTHVEKTTLIDLNARTDITICNADKNLGTVVLNTSDCVAEGLRQLEDKKFYRHVTTLPDSTEPLTSIVPELLYLEDELKDICDLHSDLLAEKDCTAMFSKFPFKPAKFYLLPKLHKPLGPCGLKGRPIVSCINYCTSPASRFVGYVNAD